MRTRARDEESTVRTHAKGGERDEDLRAKRVDVVERMRVSSDEDTEYARAKCDVTA